MGLINRVFRSGAGLFTARFWAANSLAETPGLPVYKLGHDADVVVDDDHPLATKDAQVLARISDVVAKLTASPATEGKQDAGNAVLASILAKLTASPATEGKQDAGNTVLANILTKIIAAPATEAKQTDIAALITSLGAVLSGVLSVRKGQQSVTACVITATNSLSAGIDLGVYRAVGIVTPAGLEPLTLSFESSYDGSNWNRVCNSDGTELTITVGASRRVILDPAKFLGFRHLKVRGGTSSSATVVASDRTLQIVGEA